MRVVRSGLRRLTRACRLIGLVAMLGLPMLVPDTATATPTWTVPLNNASHGQAKGDVVPAAPGGVTAACQGVLLNNNIVVMWSAVAHASTYQVLRSSTSGGTYTLTATVTAPTTTWTGSFGSGNYFFEVKALAGTNWVGPLSAPTSQRTISVLTLLCS